MDYPDVTTATEACCNRVIQTISLGFSADPVARWVWPDAKTYVETMPKFAFAFAGRALENDTAYVANAFEAVALWLPPDIAPNSDAIDCILRDSVRPEIVGDVECFFAQMDDYHPTDRLCWYLPMIAADPAYIGRGLGSALMKHALRRCDEEGIPAYLESSNPRNITLFERHGFEVIGKIQVGSSPPMHPMFREARS